MKNEWAINAIIIIIIIPTVKVELKVGITLAMLVASVEFVRGRVDGFWTVQFQSNVVNISRFLLGDVFIPPWTSATCTPATSFIQHTRQTFLLTTDRRRYVLRQHAHNHRFLFVHALLSSRILRSAGCRESLGANIMSRLFIGRMSSLSTVECRPTSTVKQ